MILRNAQKFLLHVVLNLKLTLSMPNSSILKGKLREQELMDLYKVLKGHKTIISWTRVHSKKQENSREKNLPKIFFQVDLECLSFQEKQQHLESFLQRYSQLPCKRIWILFKYFKKQVFSLQSLTTFFWMLFLAVKRCKKATGMIENML